MATKVIDLSQAVSESPAMWPRLAGQAGGRVWTGIRSTGWHGLNHPGWYDFGQPWPYRGMAQGASMAHLHPGCHVDAPKYCIPEGITADQIPLENLYGTGVIIDMRNKGKWDKIEAADFEKATPKIQAGDFVVVNTGYQKTLKPGVAYWYYHSYPGLMPSAAEWLVKKKVKAIAGTWPACDHSLNYAGPPLGDKTPNMRQDYERETGKKLPTEFAYGYEACLVMLLKAGISCISGAGGNIDDVTGKRTTLAAWPFRLEHTDGAMVRLVAIVEE